MDKAFRNTSVFIVLIIFGVQWGFYRPYTSQFPTFVDKTNVIHIHGILLMCWLTLLVIQPMLIATGRQQLHRTIGKSSYVLGPLVILMIFLVGKSSFNRHFAQQPLEASYESMVLDIRGWVSFAIFWSLAMIKRKHSGAHMRYMIATGILAIGPGIGRGLIFSAGMGFGPAITTTDVIELLIVGALLGYDLLHKKDYKPYLVVFSVLLAGALLWQIRDTAAWQSFAKAYATFMY
jgi:hypothetical protein